jgi:hypothetical protein
MPPTDAAFVRLVHRRMADAVAARTPDARRVVADHHGRAHAATGRRAAGDAERIEGCR